jgi:hypothetical protein
MMLTYANGTRKEAVLLARSDNKMRVVVRGGEEPTELTQVNDAWVSEDCEPVRVEFAWQGKSRQEVPSEAECICPHHLASRLIHLLWNGADEEELAQAAPLRSPSAAPKLVRAAGSN